MEKFFVTGANGFLGGHLVTQLCENGSSIVIYSRRDKEELEKIFSKKFEKMITFIKGELSSIDDLARAMKGCNGIFHLAGSVVHSREGPLESEDYPRSLYETNVDYSVNIIIAAGKAKVKRVVMASTSGVIGCRKRKSICEKYFNQIIAKDEYQDMPNDDFPYCKEMVSTWPYYHSKILAEERTLAFGIQCNVEVIWMRPSMIIGPGDRNFRSIKVILSFLNQSTPIIPNGVISVVDVRDVSKAFITAMNKGTPYRGYALASLNTPLRDFYNVLSEISNVPPPYFKFIPDRFVIKGASWINTFNRYFKNQWNDMYDPVRAEMSACDWSVDPIFAARELNFFPRDPRISLQDTIQWIEKEEKNQLCQSKL